MGDSSAFCVRSCNIPVMCFACVLWVGDSSVSGHVVSCPQMYYQDEILARTKMFSCWVRQLVSLRSVLSGVCSRWSGCEQADLFASID